MKNARKKRRFEMKKVALFLVLVFLSAVFVFSQEWQGKGRLFGVVLDEQGAPLEGVKVKLFFPRSNSGFEVVTDASGKWTASWIRGGTWYLDFEKVGYATKKISVNYEEPKKYPEITINLKKAEGLTLTEEMKAALGEANKLYEGGKYEESIQAYAKILESHPEAYVVNSSIGNCYFQMENYEKAEEYYQKVLEKEPQNNEIFVAIGNCYANRGQTDKALEWYNKIEFEKIKDPIVLYNIGTNYYNLSRFEDALKYYKRAVEIKPDFLDGLYQLGLAYLTLTNNEEAIKSFETYLKYDSDSQKAAQVKSFIEYLKKK
jgi:tetratricopeptide (TPR) repeat protein